MVYIIHTRIYFYSSSQWHKCKEAYLRKTKLNLSCVQGNVFLESYVVCEYTVWGFYANIGEISVTLDYISVHLNAAMVTSTCSLLLYSYDRMSCWRVIKEKNIYFCMGRALKLQASELKIQLEMLNSLLDVVTVEIRWKKFVLNFQAFSLPVFQAV